MTAPTFPRILTFYSYKGGVGRSMALMNVAYQLASWGRHVLMVDMDLEAPGISGFLHRNGELDSPLIGTKDVLTLLGEVKRLSTSPESPAALAEQLPPLSNFLRSVKREKLATLQPELGSLGRLDLLGPDLDRNYEDRFAGLGLAGTPQTELVAMSRILHFYFKAERFLFVPEWLKDLEEARPTPYDYVLVDSRTGITEIGGLCVGPLADALVVVTGLNDQNVEGTRKFLEITGIHPLPESEVDPNPSDEDSASTVLGPKPTILVASPAPNGELEYRKRRLKELELALGTKPLRLSYHPQLALKETLFVRDYQDEYLAMEYSTLTKRILTVAGDSSNVIGHRMQNLGKSMTLAADVIQLLIRHAPQNPEMASSLLVAMSNRQEPFSQTDVGDVIQLHAFLAQSKPLRKEATANLANALMAQAQTKSGEAADQLYAHASKKHQEAVRLQPDLAAGWYNWGNTLCAQARTKTGDAADRLFALSGEKYQAAVSRQPDLASAWYNWGAALSDQATTKAGSEADCLYILSCEKYQEAVRLQPDLASAWFNWGNALSGQAKAKTGEAADDLYSLSGQKHQKAVRLQPNHASAWSNWGAALCEQAKTKTGEAADQLYALSNDNHQEAVRLQPDRATSWSNWGIMLSEQAKTKTGPEAERLRSLSSLKYQKTLRLQPNDAWAWKNFAANLILSAAVAPPDQATTLLNQARKNLLQALSIDPKSAQLNLACLEAIEHNVDETIRWLEEAKKSGTLKSKSQLTEEADFDPIRLNPKFLKFIADLPDR